MAENSYKKELEQARQDISTIKEGLEALDRIIIASSANAKTFLSSFSGNSPKEMASGINEAKDSVKQMTNAMKQQQKEERKLEAAKRKLTVAYQQEGVERKILIRNAKEEAIANSKLVGAFAKLNNQRKIAKRVLHDAISAEKQNINQIKKAQREYDKYNKKVNQANAATSNFAKTGLGGLARGFKNLAGAFGIFGGIYLLAGVLKNTFNRVKEFDKSMQNLAGILQTDRKELRDIEDVIIDVASASIKTSREVASLAEVLAKLGKRGQDLKNLIGPTNDLSIALKSTSEEAGLFLVQNLNAFGAATTQAKKYARTITAINISTSLDFQKMNDAFQYITPIMRILGKDLAYTGAAIGLIADNGIKAQQAGRLLGTALQTIAKKGLSLEDALDKINEAQERGITGNDLLKIASETFGTQAAKIGVILSKNIDVLDKNTEAIRNNKTALEDLVEKQLESLEAKLEILNSAWEKFILRLENGEGVIGRVFGFLIEQLTNVVNAFTLLSSSEESRNKDTFDARELKAYKEALKFISEEAKETKKSIKEVASETSKSTEKRINEIKEEISVLQERGKEIKKQKYQNWVEKYSDNKSEISGLTAALAMYSGVLKASTELVDEFTKSTDEESVSIEDLSAKVLPKLREELAGYKKELKELGDVENLTVGQVKDFKRLTKSISDTESAIESFSGKSKKQLKRQKIDSLDLPGVSPVKEGSIKFYEDMIGQLKKIQKNANNTKEEFNSLQKQIETFEDAIKILNGTFNVGELLKPTDEEKVELEDFLNEKGIELGMKNLANVLGVDISELYTEFSSWYEEDFDNFKTFEEKKLEAAKEVSDRRKELEKGIYDATKELTGAIMDSRVEEVEKDIQLNKERYSEILDSEEWSEEQRRAIEAKRDKRELELQKKKKKREDEAFLVKQAFALAEIAMNTAIAITAAGTIPGGQALIPWIIAQGAIQAATVVAQSIPKFEGGTENAKEGVALVDEKRPEVHTDKYDNIKSFGSDKGANLRMLDKGDKIYKSHNHFFDKFGMGDMERAIFSMNMKSNGDMLSNNQVDSALLSEISNLKDSNEKVWLEVKKLASRPIHNNVNVTMTDDRHY